MPVSVALRSKAKSHKAIRPMATRPLFAITRIKGVAPVYVVSFPDPHVLPPEREGLVYNVRILGCAESACVWKFRNVT